MLEASSFQSYTKYGYGYTHLKIERLSGLLTRQFQIALLFLTPLALICEYFSS